MSVLAYTQETSGRLQGRVTDSAGSPLGGVTVVAIHRPTNTRYTTQTVSDGHYLLAGLRIGGPYSITVTAAGMQTIHVDDIEATLGLPTVLPLRMAPEVQQLEAVEVRTISRRSPGSAGRSARDASEGTSCSTSSAFPE